MPGVSLLCNVYLLIWGSIGGETGELSATNRHLLKHCAGDLQPARVGVYKIMEKLLRCGDSRYGLTGSLCCIALIAKSIWQCHFLARPACVPVASIAGRRS